MYTRDHGIKLVVKLHTCGNVLELPCNWKNFQEFKKYLLAVIQSDKAYIYNLA